MKHLLGSFYTFILLGGIIAQHISNNINTIAGTRNPWIDIVATTVAINADPKLDPIFSTILKSNLLD